VVESKIETGYLSVTVNGAFARNTLMAVDPATGKYGAATASSTYEDVVGHLTEESQADGDKRVVRMLTASGTHIGLSAAAIALTDILKAGAAGAIVVSGTGVRLGVPLEAVASGEWFEYRTFQCLVTA